MNEYNNFAFLFGRVFYKKKKTLIDRIIVCCDDRAVERLTKKITINPNAINVHDFHGEFVVCPAKRTTFITDNHHVETRRSA